MVERWIDEPDFGMEMPEDKPAQGPRVRVVVWFPVLCPECRSRDCPVQRTVSDVPGLRYHKCRTCGLWFRSLERIQKTR